MQSTRIPGALLELVCLALELEDYVTEEELEDDRLPSKVADCTMIALAIMEQSPLPLHFADSSGLDTCPSKSMVGLENKVDAGPILEQRRLWPLRGGLEFPLVPCFDCWCSLEW